MYITVITVEFISSKVTPGLCMIGSIVILQKVSSQDRGMCMSYVHLQAIMIKFMIVCGMECSLFNYVRKKR